MAMETRNSPQFLQLDSSEVSGWSSSGSPEGNCIASLSFVLGARLKQRPTVVAPPSFCDNQETWGLTRVKLDWPGKKGENIGGVVWTRISALTQLLCPGLFGENVDLDWINWRTSEFDPDNFHRNCGNPEWFMILYFLFDQRHQKRERMEKPAQWWCRRGFHEPKNRNGLIRTKNRKHLNTWELGARKVAEATRKTAW